MTGLDRLLLDLSEEQRAAVTADDDILCIVAGAGSGKTRVLTRRIAWLAEQGRIDPAHSLVLTFTRKAASELRNRLDQLGFDGDVAAGTFHSVAYAQLQARWKDRGIKPPRLVDRRAQLMGDVAPDLSAEARRSVLGEYDWARARRILPDAYPAAARAATRRPGVPADRMPELFTAFATLKKRRRLVDFDDLLSLATRDLARDTEYAEAIRWRYQHFFVDEFQDVNPLQLELLQSWRGKRPQLCVVGDPDQAIYGWNGADASFIKTFGETFNGRVISLNQNFRSTPEVVAAASAVLDPGREPPATSHSGSTSVSITGHDSEVLEAQAVARAVRDAHVPGSLWNAQAILVRTNGQTATIQDALAAAGIPYRVRGSRGFLSHPMVQAAITLLKSTGNRLSDDMGDLREVAAPNPAPSDSSEHLTVVVRLAYDHLRIDHNLSSASFAELLGSGADGELIGPDGDAVDLATFHSAKGLEWPVVHLAGLEEGYVPVFGADNPDALAEEQRLLYVAMSRARTKLTLHWAKCRTFGDHLTERVRSRFLRVFDEFQRTDEVAPEHDPAITAALKAQRQALASHPPVVDAFNALHASLLAWRARLARGADAPPAAIVPDSVIEAVASARPRTEADLTEIAGLLPVRRARYGDDLLRLVRESGLE